MYTHAHAHAFTHSLTHFDTLYKHSFPINVKSHNYPALPKVPFFKPLQVFLALSNVTKNRAVAILIDKLEFWIKVKSGFL
jgi:hypothetical protein